MLDQLGECHIVKCCCRLHLGEKVAFDLNEVVKRFSRGDMVGRVFADRGLHDLHSFGDGFQIAATSAA